MPLELNPVQRLSMARVGVQEQDIELIRFNQFLETFQIYQVALHRFELYTEYQLELIDMLDDDLAQISRDGISREEAQRDLTHLQFYVI